MNDNLIIIGASGHGKVVADIAIKMNNWKKIFFLDDNETIKKCMNFDVVGKICDAINYKSSSDFFIAIGNNKIRERVQTEFENNKLSIVSLIHPNSIIGKDVLIKSGTVVMAGVIINSSSEIGKGCILNTGATIDHDNFIDDFVHISPGVNIAGTVKIGKFTWLGIGSKVINNLNICSNCKIGAGAVVIKNVTESGTYIGVPARRLN